MSENKRFYGKMHNSYRIIPPLSAVGVLKQEQCFCRLFAMWGDVAFYGTQAGVAKKLFFHSPLWRVNFQIYSPDQTSARHIGQLLLNPLANDANDKIRMYDSSTQLEIAPPLSPTHHFERFPKESTSWINLVILDSEDQFKAVVGYTKGVFDV